MSNSGMLVMSVREGLGTGATMKQVVVLVADGVVSEVLDHGRHVSSLVSDTDNDRARGVMGYVLRLDRERVLSADEADWFGLERACFESAFDAVKAAEILVKSGRVMQVDLEAKGVEGEFVSISTLWSRFEED